MTVSKVAQQLVDFVFHDQRFKQLGVRGGAAVAFREISGREPLKEEVDKVFRSSPLCSAPAVASLSIEN